MILFFNEVVGVELFSHCFCSLWGKTPSRRFVCGTSERGGGVAHVCLAHSLIEQTKVCIFFVDLSIFGGSCSRFCKLLDVYEL